MRWPIHASDPALLWSGFLILALVAAVLIGAVLLQRARQDLLGEEVGQGASDVSDALQSAYEAGELTEEEYRKVRVSLDDADKEGFPPKVPRF